DKCSRALSIVQMGVQVYDHERRPDNNPEVEVLVVAEIPRQDFIGGILHPPVAPSRQQRRLTSVLFGNPGVVGSAEWVWRQNQIAINPRDFEQGRWKGRGD